MGRIEGKVAIVTGGAQGIGGATARRLAEEGAKVLIADIDDAMATQNVETIRAAGHVAEFVHVDVSKHSNIENMVQCAVAKWGRLDILFNNAFDVLTASTGSAVDLSEEVWDAKMSVLLKAVFLGAKHAIPEMRKVGGGSIVNTSSVHGLFGAPGVLIYETAKHAVIGATRQMAVEYGPDGIRVNAVLPGHMLTERLREQVWKDNPSGLEFFKNQYPLRDVGRAEDIANAVLVLCLTIDTKKYGSHGQPTWTRLGPNSSPKNCGHLSVCPHGSALPPLQVFRIELVQAPYDAPSKSLPVGIGLASGFVHQTGAEGPYERT